MMKDATAWGRHPTCLLLQPVVPVSSHLHHYLQHHEPNQSAIDHHQTGMQHEDGMTCRRGAATRQGAQPGAAAQQEAEGNDRAGVTNSVSGQ